VSAQELPGERTATAVPPGDAESLSHAWVEIAAAKASAATVDRDKPTQGMGM